MEERGGEKERAAQGRSGRAGRPQARPHRARPLPPGGARGSAIGTAGHRRPPPPPPGRGNRGATGGEIEGGGAPPPGKVRRE
jgi:hypothetical protein